jgi:hypothetical protein
MKPCARRVTAIFFLTVLGLTFVFSCAQPAHEPANCYRNLTIIDGAKAEFAFRNQATNGTIVAKADLLEYLPARQWPECPKHGEYCIGKIGESPKCSYPGHSHYEIQLNK